MAGNRARIGTLGLAAMLLAAVPGIVAAQDGRYGAVPNVPLGSGQGWTGGRWTGPEDGPDMRRLTIDDRRDPTTAPPVRPPLPLRPMPPLRSDSPASAQFTGSYVRPYRGWTIPTYFATPAFQVRDFQAWGLAPPGPGRRWVRYYGDAVLVGPDGRVDDVRYALDWDRRGSGPMARRDGPRGPMRRELPPAALADRAYDDGYDDGYADGHDDGAAWAEEAGPARGGYAPGTTITTTTPGTITTTTTVTEDIVYSGGQRRWTPIRTKSWAAKSRRWSK